MTDCTHSERLIRRISWLPCWPWPGGEGPERSIVGWQCAECGYEGDAVKEGEASAWRWQFMGALRSGNAVRARQSGK